MLFWQSGHSDCFTQEKPPGRQEEAYGETKSRPLRGEDHTPTDLIHAGFEQGSTFAPTTGKARGNRPFAECESVT